jgi:hypothetical protein
MRKKNVTFKLKRYPSEKRDGITHVYPPSGARTSRIVERDRLYFLANPGVKSYQRPYAPGEFAGIVLPSDMDEIDYVMVFRLSAEQTARVPVSKKLG